MFVSRPAEENMGTSLLLNTCETNPASKSSRLYQKNAEMMETTGRKKQLAEDEGRYGAL
jgi:hypothetical protein